MATKSKKIETRLHPEDYSRLKAIADKCEMSVYGIAQDFINRGINEYYTYGEARAVTVFVDNELYDKLNEIAEEYNTTIQNAAWNCIVHYLKILEKKKAEKAADNKK